MSPHPEQAPGLPLHALLYVRLVGTKCGSRQCAITFARLLYTIHVLVVLHARLWVLAEHRVDEREEMPRSQDTALSMRLAHMTSRERLAVLMRDADGAECGAQGARSNSPHARH
jgi:hypothetical protein